MIVKTILYILLLSILGISIYFLYLNLSDLYATPVSFFQTKSLDVNQSSYQGNLQFYPGMRFVSKEISYKITGACDSAKRERLAAAFMFLQSRTSMIQFYESVNGAINISCEKSTEIQLPGKFYKVGEGGPLSIINTSLFYVIENGVMLLYYSERDRNCNEDNFNIELHELLHVLGFEHSSNSESIMYSVSECNQVLTNDIVDELKKLYSIEELPDLYFKDISAVKQGSYLNFTAEVDNRGLKQANNVFLNLYDGNNKFYSYNLSKIGFGEGKIVWGITKLPGRNINSVRFVIEDGQELDTGNNIAVMNSV